MKYEPPTDRAIPLRLKNIETRLRQIQARLGSRAQPVLLMAPITIALVDAQWHPILVGSALAPGLWTVELNASNIADAWLRLVVNNAPTEPIPAQSGATLTADLGGRPDQVTVAIEACLNSAGPMTVTVLSSRTQRQGDT